MSLTSTSSSWDSSKVWASTSSADACRPANISWYARATLAGVSSRPGRLGSSPTASSSSRTARSTRGASKPDAASEPASTSRPAPLTAPGCPSRPSEGRSSATTGSAAGLRARGLDGRGRAGRRGRRRADRRAELAAVAAAVGSTVAGRLAEADTVALGQLTHVGRAHQGQLARGEHRRLVGRLALAPPRVGRLARPLGDRREDRQYLVLGQRLLVHQLEHQVVEDAAVLDEDLPGDVVRRLDEAAHLVVDRRGDLLGVVALVAHVAAEEDLAVVLAELTRAEAVAHAVLGDHGP